MSISQNGAESKYNFVVSSMLLVTKATRQRWRSIEMSKRIRDLARLYQGRAERMHSCGEWLKVSWTDDSAPSVVDARFCRDRLCPTCAWRRSRKQYGIMADILTAIRADHPNMRAYMLTLTIRNCVASNLSLAIDQLMQGWAKLQKRRPFMRTVCGWARNLEITYNSENGTMHPHFHILLLCDELSPPLPWAAGGSEEYKTHTATLRKWWLDALDAWEMYKDGVIQVDCRQAYASPGSEDKGDAMTSAALESAKYVLKSQAALSMPRQSLRYFCEAIHGRRLCAFGGMIKAYAAMRGISDIDDPDLSEPITSSDDPSIIHTVILQWSYSGSAYYVMEPQDGNEEAQKLAAVLADIGTKAS